tara:strand:+ start:235 stop:636 length:402 start_codon:yes stop_codon:yes gene_type:complete
MKKLLFLFTALLFISCSGDDDSSSNDTSINPPSWIQGRWHLQVNGVDYDGGFEFKKNDFCSVSANYATCYQNSINISSQTQLDTNVFEEISSNRYFIELTIAGSILTYEFEKVSESIIREVFSNNNLEYHLVD